MDAFLRWAWKQFTESTAKLIFTAGITAAVVTLWTATRDSAPVLTSLGWLVVAVSLAMAIIVFVGLAGWARGKWWAPAIATSIGDTMLRLQVYADTRTPLRREHANIWRWYTLRNVIYGRDAQGAQTTAALQFFVFLVFENPAAVGQITVVSPDFRLPPYEVKDSGPRHAIIIFNGPMADGDLEIRVLPP